MLTSDKPTLKPDAYFSLWTFTEQGVQQPDKLAQTLAKATAMIRDAGGTCRLHVAIGGHYDLIGVARGIDDATIIAIQHAIRSFGTLETVFIKTKEFTSKDYQGYVKDVKRFRNVKP